MDRFVRITHPGIAGRPLVSERALDHYRSLGWSPADDTDDTDDTGTPAVVYPPPVPPPNPAPSDTPIGDALAAQQTADPAAVTEETPAP